jgi:hypothetical protein
MWAGCTAWTIDDVLKATVGRLTLLHWSPRLVALAAALALVLLVLGGLGFEEPYNLYW